MLVNLTNHPSGKWDHTQYSAAVERYHHIVDLPFPHIDPEATLKEVAEWAEKYLFDILELRSKNQQDDVFAVLLMGEWTFCFQLAIRLREHSIPVLATTTVREVSMKGDQKISIFRFSGFRPYFELS
ncbi:MAG: hypothetical protein AA908_10710 [Chlorobi bacterium NICIL-2]|nr:MAG: hypothetical protein AA908_10710 [Chlorobi bacterium NICIL-2]